MITVMDSIPFVIGAVAAYALTFLKGSKGIVKAMLPPIVFISILTFSTRLQFSPFYSALGMVVSFFILAQYKMDSFSEGIRNPLIVGLGLSLLFSGTTIAFPLYLVGILLGYLIGVAITLIPMWLIWLATPFKYIKPTFLIFAIIPTLTVFYGVVYLGTMALNYNIANMHSLMSLVIGGVYGGFGYLINAASIVSKFLDSEI